MKGREEWDGKGEGVQYKTKERTVGSRELEKERQKEIKKRRIRVKVQFLVEHSP